MPRYAVKFIQPPNGVVSREVQVPDRASLAAHLAVPPGHLLEVVELPQRQLGAAAKHRFPAQLFSQQLGVLLDAGISLLEALQTLREKEPSRDIRSTLMAVEGAVQQGQPLSQALQSQPHAFDPLLCAIVAANERSGQLPTALAQHARYLAWVQDLRARLTAACVYPAMLLAVGGAVILFLLLYVLPRFSGILDGLNQDLPWASRVLIHFGQRVGDNPLAVTAVLAAVFGGAVLLWRHAPIQAWLRAQLWQLPLLGPRLKVLALARLYRSLSMLLAAGIPVLPALQIVRDLMPGPWRRAVDEVAERIGRGERLSDAMDVHALATPVALRMVRVGERSGELAQMLERAASFHDDEVVRLSDLVTRAINPALMLVMGVLIGGIILLMYMPIFALVEQVQ